MPDSPDTTPDDSTGTAGDHEVTGITRHGCANASGCYCPGRARHGQRSGHAVGHARVRRGRARTPIRNWPPTCPCSTVWSGVTVAGPVVMNDVGVHSAPGEIGGPLRPDGSRISLRINPRRLGKALITEPSAHVPPTLRLFDADGNTAHDVSDRASDRLAFEALSLAVPPTGDDPGRSGDQHVEPDASQIPDDDQIALFDTLLDDCGAWRRGRLADETIASPLPAVRVDPAR